VPFLLDSNVCIRLLNGTSAALADRLRQHSPGEIRLSTVVKAELLYGARRSARVEPNLQLLRSFFSAFETVSFDDLAAEHYGRVRADLARDGRLIGPNDLLIAASALAHDLVLVTHNVDEFSRVAGLRWQDWEG
jgi:tRNA(fMet)-specific endonuclease VapC